MGGAITATDSCCSPAKELDVVSIAESEYCSAGVTWKRREVRTIDNETGAPTIITIEWSKDGITWTTAAPASPVAGACAFTPTVTTLTNVVTTFAGGAAVTVPNTAVPANASGVTIFNSTNASITFTTSLGVHAMPPQSTHSLTLPDSSAPFSGNWSVATLAGTAGVSVAGVPQAVYVDWVTRTP
jgi:hypothetical protein